MACTEGWHEDGGGGAGRLSEQCKMQEGRPAEEALSSVLLELGLLKSPEGLRQEHL